MQFGGGSLVVGGNKSWPGVGHNSAYTFNGKEALGSGVPVANNRHATRGKNSGRAGP